MSQQIDIRLCKAGDASILWQLIQDHACYENQSLRESTQLKALENMALPATIFVVETNDIVVGYMSILKQFSTWDMRYYLYMDCLYIAPEFRGMGLGKMLLFKASDYAEEKGLSEIQWQTPVNNTNAIIFYRKCGAIDKDKKRFFLTNREVE